MILNSIRRMDLYTTLILESIDFTFPSPIKGARVEELSVGIPLRQPIYSRLKFSEFIFLSKDVTKISI